MVTVQRQPAHALLDLGLNLQPQKLWEGAFLQLGGPSLGFCEGSQIDAHTGADVSDPFPSAQWCLLTAHCGFHWRPPPARALGTDWQGSRLLLTDSLGHRNPKITLEVMEMIYFVANQLRILPLRNEIVVIIWNSHACLLFNIKYLNWKFSWNYIFYVT